MRHRLARHGTTTRYYTLKCRCDKCRKAGREYMRQLRAKLRATPQEEIPHGTTTGYQNYGCRCDKCVRAELKKKGRLTSERRKVVA